MRQDMLDPVRITLHTQRVQQALKDPNPRHLAIVHECSVLNGLIVSQEAAKSFVSRSVATDMSRWAKQHMITCVPAAGAAARYLSGIINHLDNPKQADSSMFPPLFTAEHGTLPKALIPTTMERDSFLKLKMLEQVHLFPCLGNVVICPVNQHDVFEKALHILKQEIAQQCHMTQDQKSFLMWQILEQGVHLSTVRFNSLGQPILDDQRQPSVVSAGHGELLHLFPKFMESFPSAHCVHIRNIDNIIGVNPEQQEELCLLGQIFFHVRCLFEDMRQACGKCDGFVLDGFFEDPGFKSALEKLRLLKTSIDGHKKSMGKDDNKSLDFKTWDLAAIYEVFRHMFHWPVNKNPSWEELKKRFHQPVSIFGVVRKDTGDVGGGPVVVRQRDGTHVKLCLEMPHASQQDHAIYFQAKGRATHFNPVLVFFELKTNTYKKSEGRVVDFEGLFDDEFWLLTQREHQGQQVFYHETILYELIGNSGRTNLLFVEVPRTLFNPHKILSDSLNQDRKSYGFDRIFK